MALASRTEVVESIRQRVDIVDIVARYVKLKKSGNNFIGVCPFHPDKSPSMSVSSQKGLFHCFGCLASGDVFTFLMKIEGKTFPEALQDLAGIAGIEVPYYRPGEDAGQEQERRMLAINEKACEYFETQLNKHPSGKRARDYLASRGLGEPIQKTFRLGYAPTGWHNIAAFFGRGTSKPEISLQELESVGLVAQGSKGHYDVFRDRIIFPIVGLNGKIRGFGARRLSDKEKSPKYLNSKQSRVFDKSEILYGLEQGRAGIRKSGRIVLVEGYIDVLSLVQAGIHNVVATCGTALTDRHARILRRFSDSVTTVFDADQAGVLASLRSGEILLREDASSYMVTLPKGEDPDSYVRRHGKVGFLKLLEEAKSTIESLAVSIKQNSSADIETTARETRKIIPLLAACKDRIKLSSYIGWVSQQLGLDEKFLYHAVLEYERTQGRTVVEMPGISHRASQDCSVRREEEEFLVLLIKYPYLLENIDERACLDKLDSHQVRDIIRELLKSAPDASSASMLSLVSDEKLLAKVSPKVMNDVEFPEKTAGSHLDDCIRTIRLRWVKEQLQKLQADIRSAEYAGRKTESDQMKMQKIQLMKEKESLQVLNQ